MAEILPLKLVDLGSGQGELAEFEPGDILPVSALPPADPWAYLPIGMPIPIWDHIAGVAVPPTDDPAFRYIKLTASDAYNAGVLTSESVSGSGPLALASAAISLAGSPLNGQTVQLINTERRFIRAGQSGTAQQDAMQGHKHYQTQSVWDSSPILAGISGAGYQFGLNNAIVGHPSPDGVNGDPRTANETRPKNIGATYYMRIL